MSDLVTSRDNKLFKTWVSLQSAKGIERHRLALVSGRKIVPELLAEAGAGATLILCEGAPHPDPLPARGARGISENPLPSARGQGEGAKTATLSRALFDILDELGTGAPLLVLPVPETRKFVGEDETAGLTLGVAAQDPSNLGAILRSALAFEAEEVVLLSECAHPFLPRVTRAAAGANFRLALSKGPSLHALGERWTALDTKGKSIDDFDFPKGCRLLLGEEGLGIPERFSGARLRIPIGPRAESLNVAVAAGIALAAYRRRHPLV